METCWLKRAVRPLLYKAGTGASGDLEDCWEHLNAYRVYVLSSLLGFRAKIFDAMFITTPSIECRPAARALA
eukprot:scaffold62545_cov17-Tisochrysis_lutea.AAC.1